MVGFTVPAGHSFNLDGTAIYPTMATPFISDAENRPLSPGSQIALLLAGASGAPRSS